MAWWLTWPKSDWEPVGYNKKRTTELWLHHYNQADWGYNFYMVQGWRNHQNVWKIGGIYAYVI